MSQWSLSFSGLSIPSSFETQIGFAIQSVTVYNNTPAQLALGSSIPGTGSGFPFGAVLIPAFYPITVPVQGWRGVGYVTDGTAMFSQSSLMIIASDQPPGGNPLSPFGPSGWGAGAGPAGLTSINAGDPILAWQVNQIIDFLTGVMVGQANVNIHLAAGGGFRLFDHNGFQIFQVDEATHQASLNLAAFNAHKGVTLSTQAAPGAVAGVGTVYVANDGTLHYRGSTTDTLLAPA